MIIISCENVFDLIENPDDLATLIDSLPDSSSDTIPLPPADTLDPIDPVDTGNVQPPADSNYYPPEVGENCVTYEGLWICGIDEPDYFDYDLLAGFWSLKMEAIHPNEGEHTETYYSDSQSYNLTISEDSTFSEIYNGESVAEGTWEVFPELNNQLWLSTTGDEVIKYYIIALQADWTVDERYVLNIVKMDYDIPAIVERQYERY
jgi:hypothetical protein